MTRALKVLVPGPLSTVQDLGRPGLAELGVGVSGAADRGALRLANRLLGNPESAAGVETTLGGLAVRAGTELLVTLTGAPCPATVDGRDVGWGALIRLPAGAELRLGIPAVGLRSYLGVRGGLEPPPVLGSRATDVLAGLGPEPLTAGTVLPVGPSPGTQPEVDAAPLPAPAAGEVVLRAVLGPRHDWLTATAQRALCSAAWEVTSDSNRVGIRLHGPRLERSRGDELPSEGVVRGAVQVPPSGQPTLFLADHPVTGGYPVAAVVVDADADLAGQLRPGQRVRLRSVAARYEDAVPSSQRI